MAGGLVLQEQKRALNWEKYPTLENQAAVVIALILTRDKPGGNMGGFV